MTADEVCGARIYDALQSRIPTMYTIHTVAVDMMYIGWVAVIYSRYGDIAVSTLYPTVVMGI